jgi:cell division protein FtsW
MNLDKYKTLFILNLVAIILVGLIMVYSSSYIVSIDMTGSSFHFILKQIIFLLIGSALAYTIASTKFSFWWKSAQFWHVCAFLLLLMTFIPGLGVTIKGASRWVNLGGFYFQPSEILKYSIVLVAIKFFEGFHAQNLKANLINFVSLLIPALFLIKQPDFGTFSIIFATIFFIAFLSSFSRKYFYSSLVLGVIGLVTILVAAPYRVKRIMTYLDPWSDPQNSGFQIIQSYLAFANGAITGQGLGNSQEKLFYLPEAYNDFIFSVLGEELGLVGVIFVSMLFVTLLYFGFKMSVQSQKRSVVIFISSIVFIICLQAFLNMGVVLGLLPTKGLNLPFISYGGSSLVANLMAVGFIFSALKSEEDVKATSTEHRRDFRKDFQYNKA